MSAFGGKADVLFGSQIPPTRFEISGGCPIHGLHVADPVSGGFVASLAKPGGNITGFSTIDYDMGAKWVELLKEIATAGQVELASLRGFARRSDAARLR